MTIINEQHLFFEPAICIVKWFFRLRPNRGWECAFPGCRTDPWNSSSVRPWLPINQTVNLINRPQLKLCFKSQELSNVKLWIRNLVLGIEAKTAADLASFAWWIRQSGGKQLNSIIRAINSLIQGYYHLTLNASK